MPDRNAHPMKQLRFYANAFDLPGQNITYSLINTPPAGAMIDAPSGLVTWMPQWNQLGIATLTVQATNTALQTTSRSCNVNVSNQAPILDMIADCTVHPGRMLSFYASASDPDGDMLQFSLVNGPPMGATIDPVSGRFSWMPQFNQINPYTITVRVTDGNLTADRQFTVTVANQPPAIAAPPTRVGHPGCLLSFYINASDPDGDMLTFSLPVAPLGASIDASGRFSWTPQWNQLGDNNVTVRVTDPGGRTTDRSFVITVANQQPTIDTIPDRTIQNNNPLRFHVNAFEPDVDFLTFSLIGPPPGATIDGTGLFSWTPMPAQVGNWTVTVRATDGGGAFRNASFVVIVT
jgi:hypothetical protein